MEISTWLNFLGLLDEKIICFRMNLILNSFYKVMDFFLENENFFITDTLLTLLFLASCHCTVYENENEFASIWNSWRVEIDNRPRAVPSFRRNPSRESKKTNEKNLKKKGKLMSAYLAEIALVARCTKTSSTRKAQELFAWGPCFTLVL